MTIARHENHRMVRSFYTILARSFKDKNADIARGLGARTGVMEHSEPWVT